MVERKWLPTTHNAETIPPPLASPEEWLINVDGKYSLKGCYNAPRREIAEGEIVEFDWMEVRVRGFIHFSDFDDGYRIEPQAPACPDGATMSCWQPGDEDTIAPDADEIAKYMIQFFDDFGGSADREKTLIEWYCWSNIPTKFEFRGGQFFELVSVSSD